LRRHQRLIRFAPPRRVVVGEVGLEPTVSGSRRKEILSLPRLPLRHSPIAVSAPTSAAHARRERETTLLRRRRAAIIRAVPDPGPPVLCADLAKTYRDFWGRAAFPALRGIDLRVERGESHALLGPNGSGKTTTLRILLGLMRPTRGEARLFGRDPTEPAARVRVGFLPEQSSLHGFLRAQETLELFARLHGVARAERRTRAGELLARLELADAAKKRVRELSHGMKRRLALGVALVGRPELLVLDEPTAGMDPLVREGVLALFKEHMEKGGTLLVTSHLLGDIRGIATSATLLSRGVVARRGDLDAMLRREGLREYVVRGGPEIDGAVAEAARSRGGEVIDAGPARATIEQLFLDTYRATEGTGDAAPRDR
jgi:ABC-2 type transport system ATP-binding protein